MTIDVDGRSYDGRPELRQEIIELMGVAIATAELVRGHAALGDDAGTHYCLKRFVTYSRHAAQRWNMIAEDNRRRAAEEHEREVTDGPK